MADLSLTLLDIPAAWPITTSYIHMRNPTCLPLRPRGPADTSCCSAKLIDLTLLSPDDAGWVDAYHERVWDTLKDRIADDAVRQWLRASTLPLVQQIFGEECPDQD